MTSRLDPAFIAELAEIGQPIAPKFQWYLTAVVGLGALNYPEEIPGLYLHLLENYIPESEHKPATRKIREGLTKACGIQGAAKAGNALRALATVTPPHLRDETCYRENQTFNEAQERGLRMTRSIYGPNPNYDKTKTKNASPDYSWIVTNLFYGYVFSFDKILNLAETGQIIIATLFGIDCQEQIGNHMIGMMFNGTEKSELEVLRTIMVKLADRLDVRFKGAPISVPDTPTPRHVESAKGPESQVTSRMEVVDVND